jgi:hypothetical protein
VLKLTESCDEEYPCAATEPALRRVASATGTVILASLLTFTSQTKPICPYISRRRAINADSTTSVVAE